MCNKTNEEVQSIFKEVGKVRVGQSSLSRLQLVQKANRLP